MKAGQGSIEESAVTSIPSVNGSTALLILQQQSPVAPSVTQSKKSAADNILAVASGVPAQQASGVGVSPQPTKTESKISQDMFSVNSTNLTKVKLDLFKRVGDALGIDESDYGSDAEYGAAISKQIAWDRAQPNGEATINAISQKLGLDKLGVSLDTIVDAIIDPQGGANDALDAALEKQYGQDKKKALDSSQANEQNQLLVKPDDAGIYRISTKG
jgi:hypothetical protein